MAYAYTEYPHVPNCSANTVDALFVALHEQYKRKNAAYGNSAHTTYETWGPTSYLVRISDKINRMNTLLSNPRTDDIGESILDTIGDCITYLIMLLADLNATDYAVNGKTYESAIEDEFKLVKNMDAREVLRHTLCYIQEDKMGRFVSVQTLRECWEASTRENEYNPLRILIGYLTIMYFDVKEGYSHEQ